MKLSDFILLDEKEKKLALLHRGILVAKRKDAERFFFLFQMDHYYVESCCNIEKKGVDEFRMFRHTGCLHPYLDTIGIDDLLN